jgi:hypothetical protein
VATGSPENGPRRWEGRRHFFALAAQVMRHVLVNHAEQQRTAKRGGEAERTGLDALDTSRETDPSAAFQVGPSAEEAEDVLSLHEALAQLETREPRQALIIECRFFAERARIVSCRSVRNSHHRRPEMALEACARVGLISAASTHA